MAKNVRTATRTMRTRAPRMERSRTIFIPMRALRDMKRQAYAMGNFREIARINKIENFYNGKTSRR